MLRSILVPVLALGCALLIAPATGCGGGGGGGSSSISLTPKVSSVTPIDGTLNISVFSTEVRATFDRDMDASSVNTNTFFVTDATSHFVLGIVTYDSARREATWALDEAGLNGVYPTQKIFAFDMVYTVKLTNGIRSGGLPIVPEETVQWKTSATEFGLDAAGTDPLPNATGVLIDPYRAEVNGLLAFVTLKAKIDVALDPASVDNTTVTVRQGTTPVPGGVGFDVASNTIFWAPAAASNPNPAFPGEPLLRTATSYVLTIGTGVTDASGHSPTTAMDIPFTTIASGIRAPALLPTGVTVSADLTLNEVFAAPLGSTNDLSSDSNRDTVASAISDEFVEIVNISSVYLDLRAFLVKDAVTQNPDAFDFTSLVAGTAHQALIAPGRAFVVWNGIAPGKTPANATFLVGRSKVFFGTINSGNSLWNNSGLETCRVTMKVAPVGSSGDAMLDSFTNTAFNTTTGSMVRSPELTGAFTTHSTIQSGAAGKFSPGRKTDGNFFP